MERFTAHGSRFTAHGSRSTAHGSRLTVHGSRLTVHGSRSTVHGVYQATASAVVTMKALSLAPTTSVVHGSAYAKAYARMGFGGQARSTIHDPRFKGVYQATASAVVTMKALSRLPLQWSTVRPTPRHTPVWASAGRHRLCRNYPGPWSPDLESFTHSHRSRVSPIGMPAPSVSCCILCRKADISNDR
jgi:hypothetical protein